MKELSHLNKYLYKYRYRLLMGVVFVALSNIFVILPANLVRSSLDLILETLKEFKADSISLESKEANTFFSDILKYGLLIIGMALVQGVFLFFMRQTIIVVSRKIEFDLKNEIYQHYQTLPISFYRKNNTGDLMARISEDVTKVRMYLGPALMYGINLIITFGLIIGYMLTVNVRLTFYSLLPLPILSLSIYYVNNIINKRSEDIQKGLSSMSTFVQEAFSGIRVIKAFVRESDSISKFNDSSDDYKKKSLKLTMVEALFMPLIMVIIGLSLILTIYIGGLEVIEGDATTGNIAEFIIYVNRLTWPVTALGWITSIIQRASASQKRINEFLNEKNDIISIKNTTSPISGKIQFENISLTYPESGITALDGVSFEIESGKTLAILGSTGSGKSTVASLICRLFDPSSGTIRIDGTNLKDYDISFLRKQIGYVPQDVFLFSDTIKSNIAFGGESSSDEEITNIAKDVDLYDTIIEFPKKFDTKVGERGITLSGGQKQRVSIARALLNNPKILVLDDSLSAIDTQTEGRILRNLKKELNKSTSIIISHRVSSAMLADKIIILDNGKVIQSGTPQSLLKEEGYYKNLYLKQTENEESIL